MPVLVVCFNSYLVNMEAFLIWLFVCFGDFWNVLIFNEALLELNLYPFPNQDYLHYDKFYSFVTWQMNMYIMDIVRGGFRFTDNK